MACTAIGAMVMSQVKLQQKAMSASVVLLQLQSMLMSVACVTTEGNNNHAG